jgi:hypothetical protein
MSVNMVLSDGRSIADEDMIKVITNDFLALGGDDILDPPMTAGGFEYRGDGPLTRDVLVEWFRARPSRMNAADFRSAGETRWNLPKHLPESCTLPTSDR